jgi:hypothetical protein
LQCFNVIRTPLDRDDHVRLLVHSSPLPATVILKTPRYSPMQATVKLVMALTAIGIVCGDCAAAQAVPLPRPRPAELKAIAAPDEPGRGHDTTPSACQLRLASDRAVFKPLGDISGPGECGGSDIVSLERILARNNAAIAVSPAATLRCETAAAIVAWVRDDLVTRAATLGSALATIENLDSFECRGQNRVAGARLSEHGRANALDIRGLRLKNGEVVHPTDAAVSKDFRLAMRTSVCARFTTVLGPGSDGYHEDHIHVDLAERHSGYRICQWDVREPAPNGEFALRAAVPLPRPRPSAGPANPSRTTPRPAESRPR